MTAAAIRLAARVNGVSEAHGHVSRKLWHALFPQGSAEQVPIGHVTNGVHLPTWMSLGLMEMLDRHLGADWPGRLDSPHLWDAVLSLDDATLWEVHSKKKGQLLDVIREEARRRFAEEWKESAQMAGAGTLLDPAALTIGFARRFATYKRANLLFHDINRLRRILVNPWRPVQLVFSGKAHPADTPGKEVLQSVYHYTRDPWFQGRIAFVEDYDLHIAHCLVQGVDLWLNLPRVPMEASGTSGIKAGLNAVPQLSTLDGWWAEGYDGTNGWAITGRSEAAADDAADADALYTLLENEIVPLYYERDEDDVPRGYLTRMKNALRVTGSRFTARQMVQRYVRQAYVPAYREE
jgi:starch phosphorylase